MPTFRTNCPDESHFAQKTTSNPCSLLSRHKPLLGICTYTKHPKTPPQNTPFPCLKLKLGKRNYCLGKMDPNWAKILKIGKTFLEMGKKIIHSHVDVGCGPATWHWQLLSTKLVLLARHWQQLEALYWSRSQSDTVTLAASR